MVLILLAAITCAWLANCLRRQRVEDQTIARLNQIDPDGFLLLYDYQANEVGRQAAAVNGQPRQPYGPKLLRRLFGENVLSRVASITLYTDRPKQQELIALLPKFQHLKSLRLNGVVFSDCLNKLVSLEYLYADLGQRGCAEISELKNLKNSHPKIQFISFRRRCTIELSSTRTARPTPSPTFKKS